MTSQVIFKKFFEALKSEISQSFLLLKKIDNSKEMKNKAKGTLATEHVCKYFIRSYS